MYNHVVVEVANLYKSVEFYDRLLGCIGISRYEDKPKGPAWAYGSPACTFWVHAPGDQRVGGGHICFNAHSEAEVDSFFGSAEALGGRKEQDTPGGYPAANGWHYTALVSDLDGNKIEAVYVNSSSTI